MPRTAVILTAAIYVAALCMAGETAPSTDTAADSSIQDALGDLREGRYQTAERLAERLAVNEPTPQPRAWLIVGFTRQMQDRPHDAIEAWQAFLAANADDDLRRYAMQQIALCQAAPTQPSQPQPPSSRLSPDDLRQLAAVDEQNTYVESSEHFTITSNNAKLSRLLAVECELTMTRILGLAFDAEAFPHRVEVRVWPTAKEYRLHAKDADRRSAGSFNLRFSQGQAQRQIHLIQINDTGAFDAGLLDHVLPHELCHLAMENFFGDAPCPLFLHEGLAMMAEWTVDNNRCLLAEVRLSEGRNPMQGLFTTRQETLKDPDGFYALSYSFCEFLSSRLSPEQFHDVLQFIKDGSTVGEALQLALYAPPDDDHFLPALAQAWQDYATFQGQSIRALHAATTQPATK